MTHPNPEDVVANRLISTRRDLNHRVTTQRHKAAALASELSEVQRSLKHNERALAAWDERFPESIEPANERDRAELNRAGLLTKEQAKEYIG